MIMAACQSLRHREPSQRGHPFKLEGLVKKLLAPKDWNLPKPGNTAEIEPTKRDADKTFVASNPPSRVKGATCVGPHLRSQEGNSSLHLRLGGWRRHYDHTSGDGHLGLRAPGRCDLPQLTLGRQRSEDGGTRTRPHQEDLRRHTTGKSARTGNRPAAYRTPARANSSSRSRRALPEKNRSTSSVPTISSPSSVSPKRETAVV